MSSPAPPRRRLTSLTSEEWSGLASAYVQAQPLTPTFTDALRQGLEILEFVLGPSGPQVEMRVVPPLTTTAAAR